MNLNQFIPERNYQKIAVLLAIILLGVLYLNGSISNIIAPFLDRADSVEKCTVVHTDMCHGKRYAINEKFKPVYFATHGSLTPWQCLAYAGPHDRISYGLELEEGECQLTVEHPLCSQNQSFCGKTTEIMEEQYE